MFPNGFLNIVELFSNNVQAEENPKQRVIEKIDQATNPGKQQTEDGADHVEKDVHFIGGSMGDSDFDPVLFGRVLQRLDDQDRILHKLCKAVESVGDDLIEIKAGFHRNDGAKGALLMAASVVGFIVGLLVEVWIFRGPGHP